MIIVILRIGVYCSSYYSVKKMDSPVVEIIFLLYNIIIQNM